MSRGHGDVQRRVLAVLRDRAAVLSSIDVAAGVFGRPAVTVSEASSVRRALRALADESLAVDLGRGWRWGRRGWAEPAVAAAYVERARAAFGGGGRPTAAGAAATSSRTPADP